jgi:TfoX/Sxy family transcriptional regulator of competence genes
VTMPYDEEFAARIREIIAGEPALSEKKMFGGLAFLVSGNMAVSASGHGGLMVRVDPAQSDTLAGTTPARVVEMRGRPMRGWLYLEAADVGTAGELTAWVSRGVAFARSLPAKR